MRASRQLVTLGREGQEGSAALLAPGPLTLPPEHTGIGRNSSSSSQSAPRPVSPQLLFSQKPRSPPRPLLLPFFPQPPPLNLQSSPGFWPSVPFPAPATVTPQPPASLTWTVPAAFWICSQDSIQSHLFETEVGPIIPLTWLFSFSFSLSL